MKLQSPHHSIYQSSQGIPEIPQRSIRRPVAAAGFLSGEAGTGRRGTPERECQGGGRGSHLPSPGGNYLHRCRDGVPNSPFPKIALLANARFHIALEAEPSLHRRATPAEPQLRKAGKGATRSAKPRPIPTTHARRCPQDPLRKAAESLPLPGGRDLLARPCSGGLASGAAVQSDPPRSDPRPQPPPSQPGRAPAHLLPRGSLRCSCGLAVPRPARSRRIGPAGEGRLGALGSRSLRPALLPAPPSAGHNLSCGLAVSCLSLPSSKGVCVAREGIGKVPVS